VLMNTELVFIQLSSERDERWLILDSLWLFVHDRGMTPGNAYSSRATMDAVILMHNQKGVDFLLSALAI